MTRVCLDTETLIYSLANSSALTHPLNRWRFSLPFVCLLVYPRPFLFLCSEPIVFVYTLFNPPFPLVQRKNTQEPFPITVKILQRKGKRPILSFVRLLLPCPLHGVHARLYISNASLSYDWLHDTRVNFSFGWIRPPDMCYPTNHPDWFTRWMVQW